MLFSTFFDNGRQKYQLPNLEDYPTHFGLGAKRCGLPFDFAQGGEPVESRITDCPSTLIRVVRQHRGSIDQFRIIEFVIFLTTRFGLRSLSFAPTSRSRAQSSQREFFFCPIGTCLRYESFGKAETTIGQKHSIATRCFPFLIHTSHCQWLKF